MFQATQQDQDYNYILYIMMMGLPKNSLALWHIELYTKKTPTEYGYFSLSLSLYRGYGDARELKTLSLYSST